jgi:hypothetical protein
MGERICEVKWWDRLRWYDVDTKPHKLDLSFRIRWKGCIEKEKACRWHKPTFLSKENRLNFDGFQTKMSVSKLLSTYLSMCTNIFLQNVVFWDTKTQFVHHRRHITSLLQSPACWCYVRFEVSTAIATKNAAFWDLTSCGSSKNRRLGGPYRLHHQGDKNQQARNKIRSNQQPKHAAKKCYTIVYYNILYYTILCYTILYYVILCYAMLYHTIPYQYFFAACFGC